MKTTKYREHCARRLRPLAVAVGALAALGASAARADEPSPYYIGASVSFTHDSNVYRVPDGPGDTYWSTGLLGGFDQSFSRQRVYAAANVHYNKYQDQTTLDNTSYGVNGGWDWATIEHLSGHVYGSANQQLAGLNNNALVPLKSRNLVKADQVGTSVQWGGFGLMTLQGSYAYSRVRYSAPEYLSAESSANAASVGAYFQVDATVKLGTALRYTRTYSPYGIALNPTPVGPDDYTSSTSNGRNIDLTVDWRPTGKSGMNARLSYTRQSNPGVSDSDFSGVTGALLATYELTGKTTLNASVSRDVGTNSNFFNGTGTNTAEAPVSGLAENSRTTDTLTFGANWAATAKIAVNAGAQYSRSKIVNTTTFNTGSTNGEFDDDMRSVSLGANYAIARNWQLGCNLSHMSRSVSGATGFSYDANVVSCFAQGTLR